MNEDRVLIQHILESIGKIERFTPAMTLESFLQDEKTQSAVVRELILIGEAATHFSDDFRASHPTIPLYEARGLRNHIVHEYWDINYETVWKTCRNELPILREALETV